MINVPSDATFGSALHEAVHRLSSHGFFTDFGFKWNEGANQFFTDMILMGEGLKEANVTAYKEARDYVSILAQKVGVGLIADLYFTGSRKAFMEIMFRLGITKSNTVFEHVTSDQLTQAAMLTFFTYKAGIYIKN